MYKLVTSLVLPVWWQTHEVGTQNTLRRIQ